MAVQVPKQVESVVAWAKSNVLAVVFGAIVVLVPAGAYVASGMFGSTVKQEAENRAKVYGEISSAASAKIELSLPGGETVALESFPNAETVAQYGVIIERVSKDAQEVYAAAAKKNRTQTPVVGAEVFPGYKPRNAATVRFDFLRALRSSYENLLKESGAGAPPAVEAVAKELETAERRFIQGDLKQESREKLSAEQVKGLQEFLAKARIGQYAEQAKKLRVYADMSAFEIPSEEQIRPVYSKPQDQDKQDSLLFDLQWKYWIAADVMGAFARANAQAPSVLTAPVKRVLSINVLPMESGAAAPAAADASAMSGGEVPADGSAAPTDGAPADGSAAAAPAEKKLGVPQIDPKQDAARDYAKRFTGRVTNGVYDVRVAEVTFVAQTTSLPRICDALAAQNFMTVVNMKVAPADPFAAAKRGFLYGVEPVSEVTATIETIWMRDWTAQHMPAAVRTALGITSVEAAPAGAEGESAQGM
ncbi:MAG: hypothetical protein ACKO0W_08425 [Planctomycetota bacterium]